ncbi:MAG: hypothetical protein A4S09_02675 [Proteobacteria bacterium SG_bin7]|nr:MAG: hypothetical protein A4S09_02675 [Proteobacteria bacterium SG_bin7]
MLELIIFAMLNLNIANAQTCPDSDEVQAVLSMKYSGEKRLFVCGFEDKTQKPQNGKKHLSNFGVFYESEKDIKKIFSVGASEPYWVSIDKKKGMLFEEIAWVADRYVPLFNSKINCGKTDCLRTSSVCSVPDKKKKDKNNQLPKIDILKQIDKKIRGKFTQIAQPVAMMIEMALAQTLDGNMETAKLFESNEIMDKVDLPAGQQFLVSKKIYDRVKAAGCFKTEKKEKLNVKR